MGDKAGAGDVTPPGGHLEVKVRWPLAAVRAHSAGQHPPKSSQLAGFETLARLVKGLVCAVEAGALFGAGLSSIDRSGLQPLASLALAEAAGRHGTGG